MRTITSIQKRTTHLAFAAALALMLGACAKEEEKTIAPETQPQGTRTIGKELFGMVNYTGACKFNVHAGCNGCYGYLENNSVPGFDRMRWTNQNATTLWVEGYFDPGCNNTLYCPFTKGPGAGGPVYYIIPNQGPAAGKQCLRLQVRNGTVPNWNTPPFIYNVTANTWTMQPWATNFFTTSSVPITSLPQSSCCVYC